MGKDKELFYEVIEDGESAEDRTPMAVYPDALVPERDRAAELKQAVDAAERVRYRVRTDAHAQSMLAVLLFTCACIAACGVLIHISKNSAGVIAASVLVAVAVVAAVIVMSVITVKTKRAYYCYYARTERGVFCMNVGDGEATLLAYGTAYRITRDAFFTLDGKGYAEWLDGNGVGFVSMLGAIGRTEYDENAGLYIIDADRVRHEIAIDDGVITEIVSVQQVQTDEIDIKTGDAKTKKNVFVKTEPTAVFAWEVPPFVKQAFEDNGVEFPDLTGL